MAVNPREAEAGPACDGDVNEVPPRFGARRVAACPAVAAGAVSALSHCGGTDNQSARQFRWSSAHTVASGPGSMRNLARLALALIALLLAGCAELVDSDQQRLCRSVVPAFEPAGSRIEIGRTQVLSPSVETGQVLQMGYRLWAKDAPDAARPQRSGSIICSFAPAKTGARLQLVSISTDRGPIGPLRLHLLQRFWIDSGIAGISDPSPVAMLEGAPRLSRPVAIGLQHALSSLPLISIYALLATAYALIYGLIGRINLAFGELASLAGYGAFLGYVTAEPSAGAAGVMLAIAIGLFTAAMHGGALGRLVIAPLAGAPGQHILIATIGVAMVWQEGMRLTQGAGNRWLSPLINRPFGIAVAPDFTVTITAMAMVVVMVAACAAGALVVAMQRLRFGLHWRASADDPVAASMMGVDQRAILVVTCVVAAALAGLAGILTTLFYGGVGHSGGLMVGLKALMAAIIGGIGSVSGALAGAVLVGVAEAAWSTYFPIEFRDPVMFAGLVLVLWLRPAGLHGVADLPSAPRL